MVSAATHLFRGLRFISPPAQTASRTVCSAARRPTDIEAVHRRFNKHMKGVDRVCTRLQARARRHREQANGLRLSNDRSPDWLKMKNPACAAVKREEEEDWGM